MGVYSIAPTRRLSPAAAELVERGRKPTIVGYAAVFNVLSDRMPNGFFELLLPGCFQKSLTRGDEVLCTLDHNRNRQLGRRNDGTLRLVEDEHGLFFALCASDTPETRELTLSMSRGLGNSTSFGFRTGGSFYPSDRLTIEGGQIIRELVNVELLDVSIVAIPRYRRAEAWAY